MIAVKEAMYDFVAATLRSMPAQSGIVKSAAWARGDDSALTSATTRAPPFFAARTVASRSGLAPDCEIARNIVPARFGAASYTEVTEGAAEEVRMLSRVSMRYFANVAA